MKRQTRADLLIEIEELNRRNGELFAELQEERRWLPDGVHIIKRPSEGGMSRLCFKAADLSDLEAIMPRAALLNHTQAVQDAVAAIWRQVKESVRYDGRGDQWITFPAPVDVADMILCEIEKQQASPAPTTEIRHDLF